MKHLKITISGQVQGVSFRSTAKREADRLGLAGFARNLPDGTVYIEVEGSQVELEEFVRWCWEGSIHARVDTVDYSSHESHGHVGFTKY